MSVSTSIGPVSGINYGQLITGLTALDQKPVNDLQAQVATVGSENSAFVSLSAELTSLKISAAILTTSTAFRASTTSSSNSTVATAVAGPGTAVGSYNFNVKRLASSSQLVSQGFADEASTAIGTASTLTFQFGKGRLDDPQKLANLNGGSGVPAGSIRIIDRSGASSIVDLSSAVDVQDVVNTINSASGVNVVAKINGDHFTLTDNSGGTGSFSVSDVGATKTATALGLTATTSGSTLTGSDVDKLSTSTNLNSLNNGSGVRTTGLLPDFSITSTGGTFNVSLNGAKTLGDVITKINNSGGNTTVHAALSADGHGLTLTDSGGTLSLTQLNGSNAITDLGLDGTPAAGSLTGKRLNSDLNSPLLTQLKGGYSGTGDTKLNPGHISINGQDIDLSSANTINDAVNLINTNSAGVTAALNASGTGLSLSGNGTFTVADVSGNTAAFLNIAGTATANSNGYALDSGNLNLRSVSENTPLSALNGGAGFKAGAFTLKDGKGAAYTVDLSGSSIVTVGDVISKINNGSNGIRAKIDDSGSGIQLYDTSGGGATPVVQEANNGTTAASLGFSGSFTNGKLDGSQNKTVAIAATDTLDQVVTKINAAGVGVSASVINDGSGSNPFRLSLVSRNSGSSGRLIFDGGASGLQTSTVTDGQDAVVQYGSGAGLTYTSANNNLNGVVPGLNVTLGSTGSTTISVTRDTSQVATAVQGFVDGYNKIINNLATLTNFNSSDPTQNGILFGNSTAEQIQNSLGSFINRGYSGVGIYKNATQLGISVGQDGTLTLNSDTLNSILASNPDDVRTFFTTNTPAVPAAAATSSSPQVFGSPANYGFGQTLSNVINNFTDPTNGLIFQATDALTNKTTQLNSRISDLNTLLAAKKNRLIQSFANLEVTISQLQSQGSAISKLSTTTTTSG